MSTSPGNRWVGSFDWALGDFEAFIDVGLGGPVDLEPSRRCIDWSIVAPIADDGALTSNTEAFCGAFMGSYLDSATASAPEDEPSTNSMGGGSKLLKASRSREGRYWLVSSLLRCEEKSGAGVGYLEDASIFNNTIKERRPATSSKQRPVGRMRRRAVK